MKKRRAPARRSTSARIAPASVNAYLAAAVPAPALPHVRRLRAIIRSVVPGTAKEVISYRIPAFKTDRVIVWYAAFAKHVSLFPGGAVLEQFADQLGEFKTSRGTVQFRLDEPLPVQLIKRIVKARVVEVRERE